MNVRCLSSQMMTPLLAWRNPNGSEENWLGGGPRRLVINGQDIGRIITTEISLVLLATTSIVESCVYGAIALAACALYPLTDRPFTFFAKLLSSSTFTLLWAGCDIVIYNPWFLDVMTRESYARFWAQLFNPTQVQLFRVEDRIDIAEHAPLRPDADDDDAMIHQFLNPIIGISEETKKTIDAGAQFIVEEVLKGVEEETRALFQGADGDAMHCISTRAVALYAIGDQKGAKLPNYFKTSTRLKELPDLRKISYTPECVQEVLKATASIKAFKERPQSEEAKALFKCVQGIGMHEMQGSLFGIKCFEEAIKRLDSPS